MTFDHLFVNGYRDRLCSVMNGELGQDVLDVFAYGLGADEELLRDLRLTEPVDQE
jgi:hypothetical protein